MIEVKSDVEVSDCATIVTNESVEMSNGGGCISVGVEEGVSSEDVEAGVEESEGGVELDEDDAGR